MTELLYVFTGVLCLLIFILFKRNKRSTKRIAALEESINNLENISKYFPEFLNHGEKITRNLTKELTLKQEQLDKKIDSAAAISRKLGYLEEKVRDNQLDKDTIDNILILVNQGFAASEISPRLNVPAGEIDLIIKLRKYLNCPVKEKL